MNFLDIKTDFAFKKVFGSESSKDLLVMLADKLEGWAKAYIAEGKQEGRQEGEALALQKLLAKRFGVIPVEITAQIANASLEQIEQWFDTAIDAHFLTDVFK